MEMAKAGLQRIETCVSSLEFIRENGADGPMTDEEKTTVEGFGKFKEEFIEYMDDDLNTADAISAVFELVSAINLVIRDGATKEFAGRALDALYELTDVLGIVKKQEQAESAVDSDVEALVAERQKARAEKNWARADEIRDMLKERGYTLKDTPQGVQIIKD